MKCSKMFNLGIISKLLLTNRFLQLFSVTSILAIRFPGWFFRCGIRYQKIKIKLNISDGFRIANIYISNNLRLLRHFDYAHGVKLTKNHLK